MVIKMIKPIIPDLNPVTTVDLSKIILMLVVLMLSGLSAFIISRYSAERFKGNKNKTTVTFVIVAIMMTILLVCFFGCTAIAFKGIILSLILMCASYQDIKTHECDDFIHPMILIAGLIGLDFRSLPGMIFSAGVVLIIMIGTACMTHSEIGGADIKISAACAFLLGIKSGLFGLIVGLAIAVIVNLFKKNKKEKFPMIPYLAAGFTVAYFI